MPRMSNVYYFGIEKCPLQASYESFRQNLAKPDKTFNISKLKCLHQKQIFAGVLRSRSFRKFCNLRRKKHVGESSQVRLEAHAQTLSEKSLSWVIFLLNFIMHLFRTPQDDHLSYGKFYEFFKKQFGFGAVS